MMPLCRGLLLVLAVGLHPYAAMPEVVDGHFYYQPNEVEKLTGASFPDGVQGCHSKGEGPGLPIFCEISGVNVRVSSLDGIGALPMSVAGAILYGEPSNSWEFLPDQPLNIEGAYTRRGVGALGPAWCRAERRIEGSGEDTFYENFAQCFIAMGLDASSSSFFEVNFNQVSDGLDGPFLAVVDYVALRTVLIGDKN